MHNITISNMSSFSMIMSNLVSNTLVKRYGVDTMTAMMISSQVVSMSVNKDLWSTLQFNSTDVNVIMDSYTDYTDYTNYDIYKIAYGCLSAILMLVFGYRYVAKKKVKYSKLTFFNPTQIMYVSDYITRHPQIFGYPDLTLGDYKHANTTGAYELEVGKAVYFDDTECKAKGYTIIETNIVPSSNKDTPAKSYKSVSLYVEKDKIKNASVEYYNKIVKDYNKHQKSKTKLRCQYIKCFKPDKEKTSKIVSGVMYEGSRLKKAERYEQFIMSYFSPHRDMIWNYVKKVHYTPEKFYNFGQPAYCNMLLYGPPGTGKSTLASRVLKALGREYLISIDIVDYYNHKKELFSMFTTPRITNGSIVQAKNCIFLLEEFDHTVHFLKSKENENMHSKEDLLTRLFDSTDKHEQKSTDKDKITTKLLDLHSNNQLTLGDLLELIQGSSPVDQSIIFAATNDYEYIKKTIPSVVRPGRLTPVKIDYLTWEWLQKLTEYYFKKQLTIKPFKITHPTSGIIEMAMSSLDNDDSFETFQNCIKSLNDNPSSL